MVAIVLIFFLECSIRLTDVIILDFSTLLTAILRSAALTKPLF